MPKRPENQGHKGKKEEEMNERMGRMGGGVKNGVRTKGL
jgi:hypothetical protein